MTPSASEGDTLRLEHDFAAPPERVFDAWADPVVLRDWWGVGDTWSAGLVEVDLRPGGRYRLSMVEAASGRAHTVGGRYLEVERPHHLLFSWRWEPDGPEGAGDDETLVRVDFAATATGTRLTLTHSRLTDDISRSMHEVGWLASLERLGARARGVQQVS